MLVTVLVCANRRFFLPGFLLSSGQNVTLFNELKRQAICLCLRLQEAVFEQRCFVSSKRLVSLFLINQQLRSLPQNPYTSSSLYSFLSPFHLRAALTNILDPNMASLQQQTTWQPNQEYLSRMVCFAQSILGPLSNRNPDGQSLIVKSLVMGLKGLEPDGHVALQAAFQDHQRLGYLLTGQLFRSVVRVHQNPDITLLWREFLYGYRTGMSFPIAAEDSRHAMISNLERECTVLGPAGYHSPLHRTKFETLKAAKGRFRLLRQFQLLTISQRMQEAIVRRSMLKNVSRTSFLCSTG